VCNRCKDIADEEYIVSTQYTGCYLDHGEYDTPNGYYVDDSYL